MIQASEIREGFAQAYSEYIVQGGVLAGFKVQPWFAGTLDLSLQQLCAQIKNTPTPASISNGGSFSNNIIQNNSLLPWTKIYCSEILTDADVEVSIPSIMLY